MNVGFISLGCSKNLIDTEATIGKFKNHNFTIVNEEEKADILVINTCGFIDSAKEEAIQTILEMAKYKENKCKYLIVMGCLVQRYYDELKKEIPEVDLWIKIEEYDKLWEKIEELIEHGNQDTNGSNEKEQEQKRNLNTPMPMLKQEEFLDRIITTGENYAYLKIGEGCSNWCTYCAIPLIRGPFVSRKEEDIIEEAKSLVNKGIKELIIIAQDTSKYGLDLYGENRLAELLEKLCQIEDLHWIRFLYTYPEGITEELIDVVAKNDKIVKYFDIPIQHISNNLLKRMNRKTSKENITNIIQKIREKIPNVTLRTSLIVGFPGESEHDFEELLEFVKQTKFDKLGVFEYSKEEGTAAAKMPNQINKKTKQERYNKIMEAQQKISKEVLERKIGNEEEVLIEGITVNKKYYVGRTKQDVPDIDGIVYIENDDKDDIHKMQNKINGFVKVKIVKSSNYDLIAKEIL